LVLVQVKVPEKGTQQIIRGIITVAFIEEVSVEAREHEPFTASFLDGTGYCIEFSFGELYLQTQREYFFPKFL
jgi:hypothetical protein